MKSYDVIFYAGNGERLASDTPKLFFKISDKTVFEHSVFEFEHNNRIDQLIIESHKDFLKTC
jgi:2-C-methyl-D-erythritol 4-phosphate cytidylyltransferase